MSSGMGQFGGQYSGGGSSTATEKSHGYGVSRRPTDSMGGMFGKTGGLSPKSQLVTASGTTIPTSAAACQRLT